VPHHDATPPITGYGQLLPNGVKLAVKEDDPDSRDNESCVL